MTIAKKMKTRKMQENCYCCAVVLKTLHNECFDDVQRSIDDKKNIHSLTLSFLFILFLFLFIHTRSQTNCKPKQNYPIQRKILFQVQD